MIHQAKRYLLHTAISTSLSVERFDAEAPVASGLDCMILSIDGATQQVYQCFRRKGDLGLVLENLRRLVGARRKLRSRTPVLVWNFMGLSIISTNKAPRGGWPGESAVRPADVQTRLWRFPLAAFAKVKRLPGTGCRG